MSWLSNLIDWIRGGWKPKPPPPPPPPTDWRLGMLQSMNTERSHAGLSSLTIDLRLGLAAQKHTDLMSSQGSLSHQLPGEPDFIERMAIQGIKPWTAGENIAWGQTSPEQAVADWMSSPGHRANILGTTFTLAGFGMASGHDARLYWTADFCSLATSTDAARAMTQAPFLPGPLEAK